jgi:ankyrin repeat protein
MSFRDLPAHPHVEHLKRQAKTLRKAYADGDAEAAERVHAVLGAKAELKLTDAQRVIAREYGFKTWARLRTHVQSARGREEAVDAFLGAVLASDAGRAIQVLRAESTIAQSSVHVAAVLGLEGEVRRQVGGDPSLIAVKAGKPPGDALLWLCYSPFHGESAQRDAGLEGSARALLEAGADPNTVDGQYGIAALYAVTGHRNVPRIARLLLDAGANPTDGESVFHAAEHFHEEALELLLGYGVQLNYRGEWGNTPLYFLLRYFDIGTDEQPVNRGLRWLLDHGADPNVRCGKEDETSLHMAVRQGQRPDIVKLLLEHGADVHARRGDGRTAWVLARRGAHAELASLLELAGAVPEPLAPADDLLAACARGDAETARRLATASVLAALDAADFRLLPEAAAKGHADAVNAYVTAGFPIDTAEESGATALHHASIRGDAALVRELLRRGADLSIKDPQHQATPLGWAIFGADFVVTAGGDYAACVGVLLERGAALPPGDQLPSVQHAGVREVLRAHGSTAAG